MRRSPKNPAGGRAIRAARLKAKLSQAALGRLCGVTNSAVSAWETGRDVPTPACAVSLTQALPGLTLERIYAHQRRAA